MKISVATDTGLVRPANEDAYWFDERMGALAVVDGMGGKPGGKTASCLAVQAAAILLRSLLFSRPDNEEIETFFSLVVPWIDQLVSEAGQTNPELAHMGSTLVTALHHKGDLFLTHVGDSRAGLVHPATGIVEWLTRDDNKAEELAARGALSPAEAACSPLRHHLTACLGGNVGAGLLSTHVARVHWPADSLLLLCTDGLSGCSPDQEISDCVTAYAKDLDECVRQLVGLANSHGGRDNTTVLLAGNV
jgi:protein phosphatase